MTLNTDWHKTTKASSIAASFWFKTVTYITPATQGQVTMEDLVVTGTTGAWGKSDNIQSVALAPIAGSGNTRYTLTFNVKVCQSSVSQSVSERVGCGRAHA